MNDMAINGSLTVNEIPYRLLHLLGKGKGGYSYLAERDGVQVVVKQIHHETCVLLVHQKSTDYFTVEYTPPNNSYMEKLPATATSREIQEWIPCK